jgi:hypothetical protein
MQYILKQSTFKNISPRHKSLLLAIIMVITSIFIGATVLNREASAANYGYISLYNNCSGSATANIYYADTGTLHRSAPIISKGQTYRTIAPAPRSYKILGPTGWKYATLASFADKIHGVTVKLC